MEWVIVFIVIVFIINAYYGDDKPSTNNEFLDKPEKLTSDHRLTLFMYTKSQYLKSPEWQAKRKQVLTRDRYKCTNCSSTSNLNIHHKRYDTLTKEPIAHLVALCQICHNALHKSKGFPKTYEDYMNFRS